MEMFRESAFFDFVSEIPWFIALVALILAGAFGVRFRSASPVAPMAMVMVVLVGWTCFDSMPHATIVFSILIVWALGAIGFFFMFKSWLFHFVIAMLALFLKAILWLLFVLIPWKLGIFILAIALGALAFWGFTKLRSKKRKEEAQVEEADDDLDDDDPTQVDYSGAPRGGV
jgi:predicted membrane protein